MHADEVTRLIELGLPDSEVFVQGDDGTHFTAVVVCSAFIGKSRIQKQQLVYDTVKTQLMDGSLHALSLRTFTPEEWAKFEQEEGQ